MTKESVRDLLLRLGGPDTQELVAALLLRWQSCEDAQAANSFREAVLAHLDSATLAKDNHLAVIFLLGEMMHDSPQAGRGEV
jgi:hypothetical protein